MKQPEKETLLLWVQGELDGDALMQVEHWADENPALASQMVSELETSFAGLAAMPAEIEPPYADFFNSKIKQQIERNEADVLVAPVEMEAPVEGVFERLKWIFIPASLAVMVACFMIGAKFGSSDSEVASTDSQQDVKSSMVQQIYVPNESVEVKVIDSGDVSMIVLDGLEPISDDDSSMVSYQPSKIGESVRLISSSESKDQWH